MRHIKGFMSSGAVLALAVSGQAFGQDQRSSDAMVSTSEADGIEEIVVTAQKREQRLQDVPVAVSALTSDALEDRGIKDVVDVQRAVPALTITQSQNPQNSSINLRGIGTFAFGIGIEPAVSIVVDDVALLQQAQAFNGLGDLERVEVLRGPQGTLFGKNASAGVINIATKAPTSELSAALNSSYTSDDQFRLEGVVSGGPAEWLKVRASAFYNNKEGYIDNLTTGHSLGASETIGGRLRVDVEPTSTLDISLAAAYSRDTSNPTRTWRYAAPDARIFPIGRINPGSLIAPALTGLDVGPDNFQVRQNSEQQLDSRQEIYSARATLDLGFANLSSITSWQSWRFNQQNDDADYTDLPVVAFRTGGIVQNSTTYSREFAEEMRLTSHGSGPITYMLGLYYANGRSNRTFERLALGPGASQWTGATGTKRYSVFGQGTYDLSSSTHVDIGARWNREDIDARYFATAPSSSGCLTSVCNGENSDDQITYKAALRQDLNQDVMVYASYATGYKGQGYDLGTGATQEALDNPVRPEHSKAYEVGLKGTFLNRKLQVNLTGFWTDYVDFQAQSAKVLENGSLEFKLNNVGKLRTRGIEADVAVMPVRGLRIDGSASYTDAKIISFPAAGCYTGQTAAQGCVNGTQNLSGSNLSNAPKFKYAVSGNYETTLPGLPFDGFIQADWVHQSSVQFDLLGNPALRQDGYGILNGSIGIQDGDGGRYRVSLFVNNLFDKSYAASLAVAQGDSVGNTVTQVLPRDAQRYFGVRMSLRTR
ncbi:TonB-dependent receptor [Novosphingobium mathurense]|uniref:Iron complex outermembrane recepter protein n=1 Tax=Novosphingobium mathurense TaxID=428990 RepID=A0A1U6IRT3_9SPHN|nr:TonB-dependent receptor [Novosphingobium mathurense]SLK10708.1 iron complex outermembrane recepter protein [Novosphingobium mathurense]